MSDVDQYRLTGPSPAFEVARDMVNKGLLVLPFALIFGAVIGGFPGAASVGYGLALVLVNFLLAAYINAYAAKISFALVAAAALGGYIMRLGLIFLAVWLVKDAWWVELVPLGITIIVSHLGLLLWELRYVAASMAHPGLKPSSSGSRPAAGYR